jgi:hypothetical protein
MAEVLVRIAGGVLAERARDELLFDAAVLRATDPRRGSVRLGAEP